MKKQSKKSTNTTKKAPEKKAATKKALSKMTDKELEAQESKTQETPQQPESVENAPQTEQPAPETITTVQRNYLKAHFPAVPDEIYDKPKEDMITEIERLTGHEDAQIRILLNAAK